MGMRITTYTGRRFYPDDPEMHAYDFRDIAHGLSLACRFAGQCPRFYSVAQHSLYVAERFGDPETALWGLLHDASEAYLLDLPTGLKHLPEMAPYWDLERRTMRAIATCYDLFPKEVPPEVKAADRAVLRAEALAFKMLTPEWNVWQEPDLGLRVRPMSPEKAEEAFLRKWNGITRCL